MSATIVNRNRERFDGSAGGRRVRLGFAAFGIGEGAHGIRVAGHPRQQCEVLDPNRSPLR